MWELTPVIYWKYGFGWWIRASGLVVSRSFWGEQGGCCCYTIRCFEHVTTHETTVSSCNVWVIVTSADLLLPCDASSSYRGARDQLLAPTCWIRWCWLCWYQLVDLLICCCSPVRHLHNNKETWGLTWGNIRGNIRGNTRTKPEASQVTCGDLNCRRWQEERCALWFDPSLGQIPLWLDPPLHRSPLWWDPSLVRSLSGWIPLWVGFISRFRSLSSFILLWVESLCV